MLNFGEAIEALKAGHLVQRAGWNGKGMYILKQIPATIGLDIIPKMQSLPDAAKKDLVQRSQPISYTNQMLIVHADGRADSWVPSSSDCFADDWQVISDTNGKSFEFEAKLVSFGNYLLSDRRKENIPENDRQMVHQSDLKSYEVITVSSS